MDRSEKEQLVASLKDTFNETNIVVVTHYSGLTVSEMGDLRDRMREAGAKFKVTKNRLTRLALEGTQFQGISDLFTGPTAMAYSEDPVAAAKAAVEFSKKNEMLKELKIRKGATIYYVDPTAEKPRARKVSASDPAKFKKQLEKLLEKFEKKAKAE